MEFSYIQNIKLGIRTTDKIVVMGTRGPYY